ncbi:MAG: hypothetical protein KGH89_04730 [Thaumarchaeota archaeon]|nr:hypothetical protein [Nitrososphaerota archaeon]
MKCKVHQWQRKNALKKLLKEDQLQREDQQPKEQRVKKLREQLKENLQRNAEDKIKKIIA